MWPINIRQHLVYELRVNQYCRQPYCDVNAAGTFCTLYSLTRVVVCVYLCQYTAATLRSARINDRRTSFDRLLQSISSASVKRFTKKETFLNAFSCAHIPLSYMCFLLYIFTTFDALLWGDFICKTYVNCRVYCFVVTLHHMQFAKNTIFYPNLDKNISDLYNFIEGSWLYYFLRQPTHSK